MVNNRHQLNFLTCNATVSHATNPIFLAPSNAILGERRWKRCPSDSFQKSTWVCVCYRCSCFLLHDNFLSHGPIQPKLSETFRNKYRSSCMAFEINQRNRKNCLVHRMNEECLLKGSLLYNNVEIAHWKNLTYKLTFERLNVAVARRKSINRNNYFCAIS